MHAVLFVIKRVLSGAIQGTSVTQTATLSPLLLSVGKSHLVIKAQRGWFF